MTRLTAPTLWMNQSNFLMLKMKKIVAYLVSSFSQFLIPDLIVSLELGSIESYNRLCLHLQQAAFAFCTVREVCFCGVWVFVDTQIACSAICFCELACFQNFAFSLFLCLSLPWLRIFRHVFVYQTLSTDIPPTEAIWKRIYMQHILDYKCHRL